MATMKQNTSALDALLQKIDALPEKGGGDAVLVSLDVTPSESTQKITPEAGTDGFNEVNVAAIQTETKTANANGDVTPSAGKYLKKVTVSVPAPETQEKSATPSESAQDITPDSGKYLSKVSVGAIASDYIGSAVARQAAKSVTPTKSQQTAAASGVYTTGAITVEPIPSQYIVPSGSETKTQNGTYNVTNLAELVVSVQASADFSTSYAELSAILGV